MKLAIYLKYYLLFLFFFSFCISFAPKKSEMETTKGKIIESYVEKKFKYGSVYLGHNDFIPIIKYEYIVEGNKYFSDKIDQNQHFYNSKKKAEAVLLPYVLGKEILVYYKKENPSEAYLKVEDDSKEDEE